METFQEAGVQMLKEFRALLQHSPLPLPGTRLLQLLALNMFAIESTQLKGESSIFLFCSSSSSSWSSPPPFSRRFSATKHEFSSFPRETGRESRWRVLKFAAIIAELFMHSWGGKVTGVNYALRMESIRLPIRDLNLDGFSRAWSAWSFAHVYMYILVESSRRCSGIFNFFSRILFREFPLFFIYNLSKNYFS